MSTFNKYIFFLNEPRTIKLNQEQLIKSSIFSGYSFFLNKKA